MFEVEFYEDRSGDEPIKDFILDLQAKGQTSKNDRIRSDKILTYIRVLQEYGTRAGEPYVKHIEDDIWELRPLDDRIFFFYFRDNTFVLLHHFLKKTKRLRAERLNRQKEIRPITLKGANRYGN